MPNGVRWITRSTRSQAGVAAKPARSAEAQRHRQASGGAAPPRCPPRRARAAELEHDRVGDEAPLRDPQVQVEHADGQPARGQEEQHPGGQLAGEDDLVADLAGTTTSR